MSQKFGSNSAASSNSGSLMKLQSGCDCAWCQKLKGFFTHTFFTHMSSGPERQEQQGASVTRMHQAFLCVSARSLYMVSLPWQLQGGQISYIVPRKEHVLRRKSRRKLRCLLWVSFGSHIVLCPRILLGEVVAKVYCTLLREKHQHRIIKAWEMRYKFSIFGKYNLLCHTKLL